MLDAALLSLVETQFLPAAVTVLYTVELGTRNVITRLTTVLLANQDVAPRFVTMYKVPKSGSPATSNIILPAVLIPGKTLMVVSYFEGFLIMTEGQTLQGFADIANLVTVTASGEKFS